MNNKEKILTKSAKDELETFLANERERILNEAYEKALRSNNNVEEISLRDILEATDNSRYEGEKIKILEYRRKRMSMMLALSGVMYALIGILFYIYQNSKFDIEKDFGLLIAAMGILVTFLAFFYNQLGILRLKRESVQRESSEFSSSSDYLIVERWSVIEKLTRQIIEKETSEIPKSFSQILNYLDSRKMFSESEYKDFRYLLTTRNNILHESAKLSDSKRKELIETADKLIDKLEKEKSTAPNSGLA
jgi:CRISPR/Cas system CMR-associated protein Cmr5 small subunit